jgi:hypothetical protein
MRSKANSSGNIIDIQGSLNSSTRNLRGDFENEDDDDSLPIHRYLNNTFEPFHKTIMNILRKNKIATEITTPNYRLELLFSEESGTYAIGDSLNLEIDLSKL